MGDATSQLSDVRQAHALDPDAPEAFARDGHVLVPANPHPTGAPS